MLDYLLFHTFLENCSTQFHNWYLATLQKKLFIEHTTYTSNNAFGLEQENVHELWRNS